MPFIIQTITAFVATDEDGEEGVIAFMDVEGRHWVPLVCADEKRVEQMYGMASRIAEHTGKPFKVIQFSQRMDITEETKAKHASRTGDSGQVGEELLEGVPELESKCQVVNKSVSDGTFSLEEALSLYGVSYEQYQTFLSTIK